MRTKFELQVSQRSKPDNRFRAGRPTRERSALRTLSDATRTDSAVSGARGGDVVGIQRLCDLSRRFATGIQLKYAQHDGGLLSVDLHLLCGAIPRRDVTVRTAPARELSQRSTLEPAPGAPADFFAIL